MFDRSEGVRLAYDWLHRATAPGSPDHAEVRRLLCVRWDELVAVLIEERRIVPVISDHESAAWLGELLSQYYQNCAKQTEIARDLKVSVAVPPVSCDEFTITLSGGGYHGNREAVYSWKHNAVSLLVQTVPGGAVMVAVSPTQSVWRTAYHFIRRGSIPGQSAKS